MNLKICSCVACRSFSFRKAKGGKTPKTPASHRTIFFMKKYCIKNNINLGIEGMYADISEVSGYDYSKKTIEMMSELIDELI